jgi:hypothetical protein
MTFILYLIGLAIAAYIVKLIISAFLLIATFVLRFIFKVAAVPAVLAFLASYFGLFEGNTGGITSVAIGIIALICFIRAIINIPKMMGRSYREVKNRKPSKGNSNSFGNLKTGAETLQSYGINPNSHSNNSNYSTYNHNNNTSTTFNSNGVVSTRVGDTIFRSNGTSSTIIGDTAFHSNGTTSMKVGDSVFHSDGSTSMKVGDTVFHSDGSTTTYL